jgi:hypothetical protein
VNCEKVERRLIGTVVVVLSYELHSKSLSLFSLIFLSSLTQVETVRRSEWRGHDMDDRRRGGIPGQTTGDTNTTRLVQLKA